ncbi:MAG TPA: nitrile hydratase accessory protein [Candidatus Binataceae bacterium]|nr:nitrile hydratase accessory protein [Candidatus Binataceae bacterium]
MKLEELLSGTSLANKATFSAPWEARAFAMAVRMSESSLFTWDEFRAHLIEEIAKADKVRAHGWVEPGDGYYTYFLRALEKLLLEKGLVDSAALEAAMREISNADHDDHEH